MYSQPITHYTPMVQTINNPDGTLSIIQMDPQAVVAINSDGQAQMSTLRTLRVSFFICLTLIYTNVFISRVVPK